MLLQDKRSHVIRLAREPFADRRMEAESGHNPCGEHELQEQMQHPRCPGTNAVPLPLLVAKGRVGDGYGMKEKFETRNGRSTSE
jgi:hypothetical protein